MNKKMYLSSYLRCIITYTDLSSVRVLHYAVNCDYLDEFSQMILDTFVHLDIKYTDIIFSYDIRPFFQLI